MKFFKFLLAALLALSLVFAFAACSSDSDDGEYYYVSDGGYSDSDYDSGSTTTGPYAGKAFLGSYELDQGSIIFSIALYSGGEVYVYETKMPAEVTSSIGTYTTGDDITINCNFSSKSAAMTLRFDSSAGTLTVQTVTQSSDLKDFAGKTLTKK